MLVSGEYIITYEIHSSNGGLDRGSMSMSVVEQTASEIIKFIRDEIGVDNHSITGIYKL